LSVYHQTTDPIIKYLRSHKIPVYEIAGEQPPDVIQTEINRIIG